MFYAGFLSEGKIRFSDFILFWILSFSMQFPIRTCHGPSRVKGKLLGG
jgi:hypothetical protein